METSSRRTRSADSEFVVLYGVPWTTYERILDAIGEYRLRHTYDRGTFELRRVLFGVEWEDYLKLLDATPGLFLRHTYDRGTLEMMSPRKDHDWVSNLISRMIEAFALAVDLPIQSVGSMTLRAIKGGRGLQPDKAYYLASEPLVRCKDTYDPKVDPPPDLVLEVDVTHTSLPRMPVFAKVGVPEVWRLDKHRHLRFYQLTKGKYKEVENSVAFAFSQPADFMRFVERRAEIGENGVVREFVKWAKKARAKNRS